MFAETIVQKLPSGILEFVSTISGMLGINKELFVLLVFCGIIYLIALLVLTQVHQSIVHKRKKLLEEYTFSIDGLIYDTQKATATGVLDSSACEWITNWDPKSSYTSLYTELDPIAQKNFPEREVEIKESYSRYRIVRLIENILGWILTVGTIGAYKFFW